LGQPKCPDFLWEKDEIQGFKGQGGPIRHGPVAVGIKKGDVVAFLLLNSPEHIIAFFAVLKLGAIVTPISPVYVSNEIKHQIEDSGANTLICQRLSLSERRTNGYFIQERHPDQYYRIASQLKRLFGKSVVRKDYEKLMKKSKITIKRTWNST